MARYRLRVTEFEAEQFRPHAPGGVPDGVQAEYLTGRYYVTTPTKQQIWLSDGDWIVRAPNGTGYLVFSDETFHKTYELVTEDAQQGESDAAESEQ